MADLTESNPVDARVAYRGPSRRYGTENDPMVGRKIGGVNDFGGGLGLYNGSIIGAVGVSGDSSCEDHHEMVSANSVPVVYCTDITLFDISELNGINRD